MSRPWKHPKTGTYYLRKRVPADVRNVVGSEVVKITLGTKDPAEAKARHTKALNALEARWANMRIGVQQLTEREAHIVANEFYELWIRIHRNEPSIQHFWHAYLYNDLWSLPFIEISRDALREFGARKLTDSFLVSEMRRFCKKFSKSYLNKSGLLVDEASEIKLEKAIGAAFQRASSELRRMAEGHDQDNDVSFLASVANADFSRRKIFDKEQTATNRTRPTALRLSDLLEAWWRENRLAGRKHATYESYKNTVKYLIDYLGHDDALRVSTADIISFKDYRLTTPSPRTGRVASAKTVKDSDLSALKTLFGWAVSNQKISENPASGVSVKLAKAVRLRSKGFSDAEAVAILTAARRYENAKERETTAAAKRWVPWLCAFTGARVGEIAQLRREDVRWENGRCIIRITPEAGTVKTNDAREIVLHLQLIELGFEPYVRSRPLGHLFLKIGKNGDVLGPLQGLKNRLAEFGRSIVHDPNVAPNHGWRHRFKTVGMEAGIAPRILDAIQGQAARTVADTYGEVTLKTIAAAIDRLPAFDVSQ